MQAAKLLNFISSLGAVISSGQFRGPSLSSSEMLKSRERMTQPFLPVAVGNVPRPIKRHPSITWSLQIFCYAALPCVMFGGRSIERVASVCPIGVRLIVGGYTLETAKTVLLALLFTHVLTTVSGCVPAGYDGAPRTAAEWHERAARELRRRQLPEGG